MEQKQSWAKYPYGKVKLNSLEKEKINKIINFFNNNPKTTKVSVLRLSKEIKEPRSSLRLLLYKINNAKFITGEKRFGPFFYLDQAEKRMDKKCLKSPLYVVPLFKRKEQ